jgi:hypothetical protein
LGCSGSPFSSGFGSGSVSVPFIFGSVSDHGSVLFPFPFWFQFLFPFPVSVSGSFRFRFVPVLFPVQPVCAVGFSVTAQSPFASLIIIPTRV